MTKIAYQTRAKPTNLSRRKFIVGSAAAGGGLALGMQLQFGVDAGIASAAAKGAESVAEINAWVVVRPDETCVLRIARSEMGQGTLTGLAQLVAEELECNWKNVTTESPTAGENYARKRVWGEMGTGGSRGIRTSEDYVRRGGAAARIMLLQAAADEWKVPASEVTVSEGVITHAASGRKTTYGKVAAAASKLTAPDPKSIKLKDPHNWTIAGKPVKRLDTADKLNGSKVFAIDLRMPGMLNATIKQSPVFGGKLVSFDDAKVMHMPGVKRVVRVNDSAVAVVADTWWHAKKGIDALTIVWDEGAGAAQSSATIGERLQEGLTASGAYQSRVEGDALKAIDGAAKKVEVVYSTPFLAHATMEPMNCTARITADRAECWVPTQNAEASFAALSEESGLPLDKCEVYRIDLGGGFGRRGGTQDYVRQAASIAKQFPGVPIKLVWTREEDMMHDFYRPISQARGVAGLDANGKLVGVHLRVSGQSINAFLNPSSVADGKDERQMQGYYEKAGDAQLGYTFPTFLLEYAMRNSHVPVGPWRGVNTNQNARVHGMLHGRDRACSRHRSARVSPCLDDHAPQASRGAQCRGGKSGVGQAVADGRVSRHRPIHGLRQLFGGGRGSVGQPGRQAQGASHGAGAQLRARREPAANRGAGRRLGRVRTYRDHVRRMPRRKRAHGVAEFQHLRDHAPGGNAKG